MPWPLTLTANAPSAQRQRAAEVACEPMVKKAAMDLQFAMSRYHPNQQLEWLHKQPHNHYNETPNGLTNHLEVSVNAIFPWIHINTTVDTVQQSIKRHADSMLSSINEKCVTHYLNRH